MKTGVTQAVRPAMVRATRPAIAQATPPNSISLTGKTITLGGKPLTITPP